MFSITLFRPWQIQIAVLLLVGCAGNMAHQQGVDMLDRGSLEEAYAKLAQASRENPDNHEYRTHFLNARALLLDQLSDDGQRELALGNYDVAEAIFRKALSYDRNHAQALEGLSRIEQEKRHNRLLADAAAQMAANDFSAADRTLVRVLQENPRHAQARELRSQLDEKMGRRLVIPARLGKPFQKPVTLEFRDTSLKQVLEALSRHSGLNFVLDKDVPPNLTVTVFLREVSVETALDVILSTNQLLRRTLSETTTLIYPDTPGKQSDHQDLIVKNYFLANAEAKQVMNMLKTVFKAKNVFADDKLNLLIMRDTPAMIRLADWMVATQDVSEPEVMLEVEVLEVQRDRLLNLGIQFPNQLTLSPLPSIGTALTLRDLKNLNSARLGAAISPTVLNLQHQVTENNLLANPRIRTHNREKAVVRIGDRVPVITTTATSTGFVSESVQYLDVGLKLEVEPTIYPNDEISIKLGLEVSSVAQQIVSPAGTVSYQLSGRNASTVLRLKDGETQTLAGLINDEDRKSANHFPGLGQLPVLGRLFSNQKDDKARTELVLAITPRLVRGLTPPAEVPNEFWSGTENNPRLRTPEPSTTAPRLPAPPSIGDARPDKLSSAAPATAIVPVLPVALASASSAGSPSLRWEAPAQVAAGSTVKLKLKVASQTAITGFPLQINYDPKVLELLTAGPGGFMAAGNAIPQSRLRIDDAVGMVFLSQSRTGSSGASGEGDLAELEFRALKPAANSAIYVLPTAPTGVDQRPLGLSDPAMAFVTVIPSR